MQTAGAYAAAAVSCALSVRLFIELGDSVDSRILLGILATIFEAAKLLSWRRRNSSWFAPILAAALVCLSLFASMGSALVIVEGTAARDAVRVANQAGSDRDIASLEERRKIMINRLSAMPATWATKAQETSAEIEGIDREIFAFRTSEKSDGSSIRTSGAVMFTLLAEFFGVNERGLIIGFLFAVAVVLELVLLTMVPADHGQATKKDLERNEEDRAPEQSRRLPSIHSRARHDQQTFDFEEPAMKV
jgi:hypothetical protein